MDRVAWNNLVALSAPRFGAFLQSWEWGEFQESLGRSVERIHREKNGETLLALAVRLNLPLGMKYWFVPKGPLGTMNAKRAAKELRGSFPTGMFLRLETEKECGGWRVRDMNPSTTSIVDLTHGWEHIERGMKAKTRYNIRLAEKKGVVVKIADPSADTEAFDDFTRLLEQTAVRDGFSLHPLSYYKAMLASLRGESAVQAFLAIAYFDDRPIAANLMIDFNGQRTYVHGASSNLHRNVMAPYLLHKFLIVDAIAKGMTSYDFWGVAPVGSSAKHPWAGVTRFKLGFGGEIVSTPGTVDFPLNAPLYTLYRCVRLFRKPRARQREIAVE